MAYGDAVGGFSAAPSGGGNVNEVRDGWRYTGNPNEPGAVNGWSPPAGYTDASGGGNGVSSTSGNTGGNYAQNALDLMKQAQAFQVQQNQPAIQSLTARQQSLPDQYAALLKDIQGGESAAMTFQTGAVNTSLAQRGIDPNSVYGQQQFGSALTPIHQQFGPLEAQVGQGSVNTLQDLATQIASLQQGNVPSAQNFGANITGLQEALQQQQLANLRPQAGSIFYDPATKSFQTPPTTTPPTTTNVSGNTTNGGGNQTTTTGGPQPLVNTTQTPLTSGGILNGVKNGGLTLNVGNQNTSSNNQPNPLQSALSYLNTTGQNVSNSLNNLFNFLPKGNQQPGSGPGILGLKLY